MRWARLRALDLARDSRLIAAAGDEHPDDAWWADLARRDRRRYLLRALAERRYDRHQPPDVLDVRGAP